MRRPRHRLLGPVLGLTLLGAALIVPTTAAAATATCDEGRWPAAAQGAPVTYHAGARAGDYLWHNGTGWHLRVTHPGSRRVVFSGRIVSDQPLTVSPVKLEAGDTFALSADKLTLTYHFVEPRPHRRPRHPDRLRHDPPRQGLDVRREAPGRPDLDRPGGPSPAARTRSRSCAPARPPDGAARPGARYDAPIETSLIPGHRRGRVRSVVRGIDPGAGRVAGVRRPVGGRAHRGVPAPDRPARPGPPFGHRDEPRGARHRRAARCRTASRPRPWSAPRDRGPGQGQHRHQRRDGDDGRIARAGRQPRPARRHGRGARSGRRGPSSSGKANLTEWANFRGAEPKAVTDAGLHLNGWSARGGFTRNPYDLATDPCGSSSGSAVATAANLCAVAIGTETDGSIVCPSAWNAIVGLKPTVGLVSQAGVIPISHSQDTVGPMTRTVTDAAILLDALRSPFGDVAGHRLPRDYRGALRPGALRGARIGVDRRQFSGDSADEGLNRAAERAFETLAALGATLVDPIVPTDTGSIEDDELTVMFTECKAGMDAYLATAPRHAAADPRRRHRLQRRALRGRAPLLRPGAVRDRRRDGGPGRSGLPRGPRALPDGDADERHRPDPRRRATRRHRGAGLR